MCLGYAPLLLKSRLISSPGGMVSLLSENYKSPRSVLDCSDYIALEKLKHEDGLHFAANKIACSLLSPSSAPVQVVSLFSTKLSESSKTSKLSAGFFAFNDSPSGDSNVDVAISATASKSSERNLRETSISAAITFPSSSTSAPSSVRKVTIVASPTKHAVNVAGYSDATLVKARLKTNFYTDAKRLNIPSKIIESIVNKMSSVINFKNSLRRGDTFEVIYTKDNNLLYSRIITRHSNVAVYRFSERGNHSYCFENGNLCETTKEDNTFGRPLKGKVTVSDRYGVRRHPISGVIRFHSGVDLAAAFGEPVFAIQDGTVTRASYFGGYGKCVDIRHASGYSSRYAHLSRFNVINGTKVRKGQLIGFVGSTGHSTGAHLHLELARNDRTMNPFSVVKMTPPKRNTVRNYKNFAGFKNKISAVSKMYKAL